MLDSDNTVPIEGFNGAVQWTDGNGYLPLLGKAHNTDAAVPFDIGDADSMEGVVYPLLSMGKMLRLWAKGSCMAKNVFRRVFLGSCVERVLLGSTRLCGRVVVVQGATTKYQ